MNIRRIRKCRARKGGTVAVAVPAPENSWDLNMLTNNLPGGIMSCDATPELNLIQYSDGFLTLFGYSREEIETRFHNRFSEMIWQEDIEATWADVRRQMAKGNTKQIEYRVKHKDGRLISVLDRGQLMIQGGKPVFCCILIDETETKQALEALRLSFERYQIIMDQTTDIIFEWDIGSDSLVLSQNWKKKFGYRPVCSEISTSLFSAPTHLHPDDLPKIREAMERIASSPAYVEVEFRIMKDSGQYIWCRARVTPQQGSDGCITKAIGVIVDIDEEKRTAQNLLARAERDTLTGLYNKGTAQALAERYISEADSAHLCAFMIIDVDDFKYVNDVFGHLSGDVMLSDIGAMLQKMFRGHDVLGRIGGDEFAVLMRDISDIGAIPIKAQDILYAFSHLLNAQQEGCNLSCSIGISLAPADGMDFQTIYQKADTALYHAKMKGKNQFAFYSPELPVLGAREGRAGYGTAVSKTIDSEREAPSIKAQLAEYVFHVLYQSEDIMSAIPPILEIVGRQFDVSCVYVFEDSADGSYCNNTYEWCSADCEPQKDNLQQVSYAELLGDYYTLFDENGVFYCRDVGLLPANPRDMLQEQDIKSLLQCAIRDNGRNRGFVGFDECRMNRFWTQEQISALSMIAEIISIFLLKSRAQSHTSEMLQNLTAILDHQDSWIYAVEAETHRILYMNRKMQELLPCLAPETCCYEAFFKRGAPCENCPLREMRDDGQGGGTMFSYLLSREVRIHIAKVPWSGEHQAYLFSCFDLQG
ncbi:diguanylate cyclase [Intestinibacillus massiliensis]|nr:diguanylate cyclase [Intestinibacillus massiliensis]